MSSSSGVPSLTTSERLIFAVVRAARTAGAASPELREAVCDYVRELKSRDEPPERVLVAVKTLVAEAGVSRKAYGDFDRAVIHPEHEVLDHLITWCIEEYFHEAPRSS